MAITALPKAPLANHPVSGFPLSFCRKKGAEGRFLLIASGRLALLVCTYGEEVLR